MPMRIDPFAVPDNEKIDLLMAVNAAAKASGADFSAAWVNIVARGEILREAPWARASRRAARASSPAST